MEERMNRLYTAETIYLLQIFRIINKSFEYTNTVLQFDNKENASKSI